VKKIKILQLITGLSIGGAEKVLLDLCHYLDKDKIECYVVGLNHEDVMNKGFEKEGVFVKNLGMKKDIKSILKSLKEFNSFMKNRDIDIIHAHMFHSLIFAYIAKLRYPKLKIIFTPHSENIGSKLREKITKYMKYFRDTDIIFSEDMYTDMYKSNVKVIPNGIDIEKFVLDLPKNRRFTFISVGVLREGKNHIALVEYAKTLKSLGYDFEIHIVGSGDASGDEQKNIEEAIKKAEVNDVLKMFGSRDDIPELLNKAHCFVMPSLYEGLPISLLEAGAAGLPIISTPVGAIPTVIGKEYGYLAKLDKFGESMEYVLNHKEEAMQIGQNFSKSIYKQYSIKNMVISLEEIYQNVSRQKSKV
jgi:glycosyltransferase involved in cell wall biosynthesis